MQKLIRIAQDISLLASIEEVWNQLAEVTEEANDANRQVRVTRNELDGAVQAKFPDRAVQIERAATYQEALVRDTAARLPLRAAIDRMFLLLPKLRTFVQNSGCQKGSWPEDALKYNIVSCQALLQRAAAALARIQPYDLFTDKHFALLVAAREEKLAQAEAWLDALPQFPLVGQRSEGYCNYYDAVTLWSRCVQLAQRQGGRCTVIVERFSSHDISEVTRLLRRKEWFVRFRYRNAESGVISRLLIAHPSCGPLPEDEPTPVVPEALRGLHTMVPGDASRTWMRDMAKLDAQERKMRTAYELGRAAAELAVRAGACSQADFDAGLATDIAEEIYVHYEYEFERVILSLAD